MAKYFSRGVRVAIIGVALIATLTTITVYAGNRHGISYPRKAPLPLSGVAYGPYRGGQNPNTGIYPSDAEIQADMPTLATLTQNIRTYSSLPPAASIVQSAQQANLNVSQGVWLGPNTTINSQEMTAGEQLATNPAVKSLIVGNEVLLRGDLTKAQLEADITQVRNAVGPSVQITTADSYSVWLANPDLANYVDFITVHIYPFWNHVSIDQAISNLDSAYAQMQAAFPTKSIVIGETGWPSAGPALGSAVPDRYNQSRYLHDFMAWAKQHGVAYYFFEFADEAWKAGAAESFVGDHWGMFYGNGTLKLPLQKLLPAPAAQTLTERSYLDTFVGSGIEAPFNIGIDTSNHVQNWLTDEHGAFLLAYPANQAWGSAFFTSGPPASSAQRQSSDMRAYRSLTLDLRGVAGGECVDIGIKDLTRQDDGTESKVHECLTTTWTTFSIPLTAFPEEYLSHLYVVCEINFTGSVAYSVEVRNVRYSVLPLPPGVTATPITHDVFWLYQNTASAPFAASGWMGDTGAISLNEAYPTQPHSGTSCIQVVYSGLATNNQGWAGIYWQFPANNWGTNPLGYNLSFFTHLSFWVRGNAGGEQVQFFVGGITGQYPDSLQPVVQTAVLSLTTSWQQITIDLSGKDLTHVIGGFGWSASALNNPSGATFYLDDIQFSS